MLVPRGITYDPQREQTPPMTPLCATPLPKVNDKLAFFNTNFNQILVLHYNYELVVVTDTNILVVRKHLLISSNREINFALRQIQLFDIIYIVQCTDGLPSGFTDESGNGLCKKLNSTFAELRKNVDLFSTYFI